MKLSAILTPSLVKTSLGSVEKEEVFEEMVQVLIDAGRLREGDRDEALRALFDREAKMTTGVVKGLGLPHGKIAAAKELLIALGVSPRGIEYQAMDGAPVHVVIMVFAEIGNPGPHIEALAEVSRLFTIPGFLNKVMAARNGAEVVDLIRREE
ncbi:MAG: PTS system fructose-specific EIIABC component [Lentisphaerae bacterium ADurb.BinA184]|nr:MAG: PTS system fructose-specific EIIABC component [Lentisphaerae bacterium ADurb.BinA184]